MKRFIAVTPETKEPESLPKLLFTTRVDENGYISFLVNGDLFAYIDAEAGDLRLLPLWDSAAQKVLARDDEGRILVS